MASANLDSAGVKKLLDNLQSDLKNISLETKKRHPAVKESAEEAIVKIRNAGSAQTPLAYLSNQILYPLVQGCETKDTKVVTLCLQVVQRLITAQVCNTLHQELKQCNSLITGVRWKRSQVCGRDHVDVDGGRSRGGITLKLKAQIGLIDWATRLMSAKGEAAADSDLVDDNKWRLPRRLPGSLSGHLLQAGLLQRWHCCR